MGNCKTFSEITFLGIKCKTFLGFFFQGKILRKISKGHFFGQTYFFQGKLLRKNSKGQFLVQLTFFQGTIFEGKLFKGYASFNLKNQMHKKKESIFLSFQRYI